MKRRDILTTAADLIDGDRAATYGSAHENFARIAALWGPVLGVEVTPIQVAACMAQVKVARLITNVAHADSWVDAAGYIALGGEIATEATR